MNKEVKLIISKGAISEIRSQLITAGVCSRPLSASEQTVMFIIKAIEENKGEVTIELKSDLKKKKKSKKRKN